VLDLDSGALIGKIPGKSVHGIAVVKEFGRGFISCSDPGSIVIFDLKTLAVIDRVPVGDDPNVILFDRKTRHIFTADRGSKRVTALDPKTGKVVGTIEGLGGKTEHAASDDAGNIFINMQDLNTMLKLDSQNLKVLETWPMAPCQQPSSMDIDRAHHRVFVGCRSGVMAVVDANSGKIVTTQPIGRGGDATEFDPDRGLVYFSCGDGTMAVFHEDSPDKYSLVETVKTQTGARTMAVDRKIGRAFLSVSEFGPRPDATGGISPARAPMVHRQFFSDRGRSGINQPPASRFASTLAQPLNPRSKEAATRCSRSPMASCSGAPPAPASRDIAFHRCSPAGEILE